MSPDEGKIYSKLTTAGREEFARDVSAEAKANPSGGHPASHQKLMQGYYNKF